MAEAKAARAKTQYRVFKYQGDIDLDVVPADDETPGETQSVELFALLPGTFDGNVFKKAHAEYGDGAYAKCSVTSFDRKTAAVDPTPRVKIA